MNYYATFVSLREQCEEKLILQFSLNRKVSFKGFENEWFCSKLVFCGNEFSDGYQCRLFS